MPSSSPPPSSPQPVSLPSLSTKNTPRPESVAAFPRLSITIGQNTTSSADSSRSGSPAKSFSPAHATNKLLGLGVHSPLSSASSDLTTKAAAHARRATVSDAVAASSTSSFADNIEMDPITPAGHRRRRSSLMSPSSSTPQTGRNGHARGPSVSGQFVMDEPKISEESESTIKGKDGIAKANLDGGFSDEDLHDDEETGLTAKDRKRKQRKRRRNTLLDQRIAHDKISEEKREADQTVVRKLVINGALIGLWYLFSLCISLVS